MSEPTSSTRSDAAAANLAVFADADHLADIGQLLAKLRRPAQALQAGGVAAAIAWCTAHAAPALLLVDIGDDAHPLPALQELAALAGPSCHIVALGRRQDVDLYRRLLQAGLFDYLATPLALDLLADTLRRADHDQPLGQGSARTGHTVAVVGTGGGLGTSTLVVALGQWLSQQRQTPTVLVDFDRRKGDLPLLLGVEADTGLSHLLAAPEIDPRLLQRTLLAAGHGSATGRLQLLAQRAEAETPIPPERALELGAALCQLFSLSLWDLPAHRPPGADEVLSHADVRVVLTELSVQGARNTHRLLAEIGDESAGQRLLLLTSGAHQPDPAQPVLQAAQFADFVGRGIDLHLPHAGPALAASLLQGALSAQAAPAYAQAVARLGARLLGQPEPRPTATGLAQRLGQWLGRAPAGSAA